MSYGPKGRWNWDGYEIRDGTLGSDTALLGMVNVHNMFI
jgi:hypothetical protein